MVTVLLVLSVIAAVFGLLSLSEATMGVGVLALACLLGIFARIAQAHQHHQETHGGASKGNGGKGPGMGPSPM